MTGYKTGSKIHFTTQNIDNIFFTKNAGYTRPEIIEKLNITDGETFTKNINALLSSDFAVKYVPFGFSKRDIHYKLVDPFCLFYHPGVELLLKMYVLIMLSSLKNRLVYQVLLQNLLHGLRNLMMKKELKSIYLLLEMIM